MDRRTDRFAISISRVSMLTRDKKLHSRYCTIDATKLSTDKHEASRGLFATAELLVIIFSLLLTDIICPQTDNWISDFMYSLFEKKTTAYTCSQKLLNKSAISCGNFIVITKQEILVIYWYILLTSSILLHDVMMTSWWRHTAASDTQIVW